MTRVVVETVGNSLTYSADGRAALPPEARDVLEPALTYTQLIRQVGHAAWDQHGHRSPMRTERKVMYQYDGLGRLVTKAGFRDKLAAALDAAGLRTQEVDRTQEYMPKYVRDGREERLRPDWDALYRVFTPRARQDEALAMLSAYDRGIIEAPTGFGKTVSFCTVPVLYPRANILVVCTRKDVVQAIVRGMSKYVPNVAQIGGGKRTTGRVTVCTAQSLKYVDFERTDIVLADEAHELAAGTYAGNLGRFGWARMYGYSASPWARQDGTGIRIEALFGSTIFIMTYQEAVALGLVVPIRVEWLDMTIGRNPAEGLKDTAKQRHGVWRNDERNARIAAKAKTYGPDEQVLIMCTTFEHLVQLRQHLPDYTLCYAERASDDRMYDRFKRDKMLPDDEPPMTDRRRQTLRDQFERGTLKKVIATDVWSTGVSFDGLSVMIRADARSSAIMDTQIPGRVSRTHVPSGKEMGVLVDCLDQFDGGMSEAARKRRRNYTAKGWEQVMPPNNPRLNPY